MTDLNVGLKARAKIWAQNISRKANSAPGKPGHIRVSSKVQERNGMIGIVSTGVSPTGDARAYEFGSGVRSRSTKKSKWQMGSKGKILITPKRKKTLAFFWDKVDSTTRLGPKFRGISDKGKAIFNYVEHPGVRAANNGRGYMAPAISEVRKQMRKEIPEEVRKATVGAFRRAFKKGTK